MSPAIPMQSVSHGYRHCRFITFYVSRRSREMNCGHAFLCVSLSAAACPHYCIDPGVTWGYVVRDAP